MTDGSVFSILFFAAEFDLLQDRAAGAVRQIGPDLLPVPAFGEIPGA